MSPGATCSRSRALGLWRSQTERGTPGHDNHNDPRLDQTDGRDGAPGDGLATEVEKGHEEREEERGRDDRYHRNHVAAHFGQLIINWPLSHRTLWWVRKPLSVHAWTTLFK